MVSKPLLMWDETLFRDPDVFEIDYIPDQFNYRENQMREMAFQLRPGLRGSRPLNAIIKGSPGTGKTTSIKKVFSEIDEMNSMMISVHVNCQIDNTKFLILSQIYKGMYGHLPSHSGNSYKRVMDSIAQGLIEMDRVLMVAFDDANYLLYENELNTILYLLLRSHESYPGTRIGAFVIFSDMAIDIHKALDIRVTSVFNPTDIYFSPYSRSEIFYILKERVMQGFYPGVLSDDKLEIIVEHTFSAGDMRIGIDMLKRAGLSAENAAERSISENHITEAYHLSKIVHLKYCTQSLNSNEKNTLKIIAEQSKKDIQLTTGDIFTIVKKKTKIGYTNYYTIIQKLDSLRLINLTFKDGRGRTRLLNLRYEPDEVISTLK